MSKPAKSEFLNLTPFVDLFSTLVIFLLMTAVWTQIAALSTNAENATTSSAPEPTPPPKKVNLKATIFPDRIEFFEDEAATKIAHVAGDIDAPRIEALLDQWRIKYPDRKDIILNTADQVAYRFMIRTFDTMVGRDWPDVGVSTQ